MATNQKLDPITGDPIIDPNDPTAPPTTTAVGGINPTGGVTGYGAPGVPAPQVTPDPASPDFSNVVVPVYNGDPAGKANFDNYVGNYWAPDRQQVLNQLAGTTFANGMQGGILNPAVQSPTSPTIPSDGSTGASAPAGSAGYVAPVTEPGYSTDPTMEAAIQKLLEQGQSPVSANDPAIKAATDAYGNQQTIAARQARSALAERDSAEGLNSGGAGSGQMDSAIQSQIATAGNNTAQFSANQVINEIQARRQDVVNALTFAQGEEKLALQQQLASMNDQLQRAQMAQQNGQFYDAQAVGLGEANQNYNLQYLQTILGL